MQFNVVFFVSRSLNIHRKPWKWIFVHQDCSEHSAITEKVLIGVLRTKQSRTRHICNHVYSFFVCVARLEFFLVKFLGKSTNCNINGIFNYNPDFRIPSFNSYCPVRDKKLLLPGRNLKCHAPGYLGIFQSN